LELVVISSKRFKKRKIELQLERAHGIAQVSYK